MLLNNLSDRLGEIILSFPDLLERCTWVDAQFECIRTDADLSMLIDPEELERKQKDEIDRFNALDKEQQKSAIQQKNHKRALYAVENEMILDVLRKNADFVLGVSRVDGTGGTGKWVITVR